MVSPGIQHVASLADIARLRLQSHGLAGPEGGGALAGPLAVTQRLLAVQAQDFAASKWALGARSPGTTLADVDAALASGVIVRSWPMRATLNLVPATDLQWMLRVSTPRLVTGARTRHAQLGLTTELLERAREIAIDALTGARVLTRAEFLALLESNDIDTTQQRGYNIIWFLSQTGTLCWGPLAANQQALVLLDEWVPVSRELEPDEALAELALRYFTGHGPATVADLVSWSKLTLTQARTGLAIARPRLTELTVNDGSGGAAAPHYFVDTGADAGGPPVQRSSVLALPGFDEYLLGYRDRTPIIDDADFLRVVPGKNGIFLPLLVSGGRVVGTWRKTASARAMTVVPQPFDRLTVKQQAGLRRSIRDYGRFLGVDAGLDGAGIDGAGIDGAGIAAAGRGIA